MDDVPRLVSKRVRVENYEDAINSAFIKFAWSDGLPISAPTEERVSRMLSAFGNRDPQEVVAILPPRIGAATLEKITINAVMAGSRVVD